MDRKSQAYSYLQKLESYLIENTLEAEQMRQRVAELQSDSGNPHKIRENIFLYEILPAISQHMQTVTGIDAKGARDALACEYHRNVPGLSAGNGFRAVGHPFSKQIGESYDKIFNRWIRPESAFPINQVYPDLAFRRPFPYKIVFDAKYFVENSEAAAKKALVSGAYEAAFYRGLPQDQTSDLGWDYEFGCLLAYDASLDGVLKKIWTSVSQKNEFWNGANVYMMII